MRLVVIVFLVGLIIPGVLSAAEQSALSTNKEKVNYTIGVYLVNMLKQQGVDFDPKMVLKGFADALNGKDLLVDEDEYNRAMKDYQKAVRQARNGKSQHNPAADNLRVGEKFLTENRKKAGVAVTKSGLQYRVMKVGSGKTPSATDTVEYSFRELLLNRKEIDSSAKRGKMEVASLKENLLPAVREALLMMKPGDKWELFIPANLAYGEEGKGDDVPAHSALIYEIELLAVK